MLNKSLLLVTSLFAFVCLIGLSGCSSDPVPAGNYSSKYTTYYTKVSNLPADYPTRYLPNGNVWDDFRHHMQLPPNLNNRQVQAQIRWYRSHPDFLNRSLTRGAQYFYYIFQQTKQRNLPAELALIPIFESGYVPVGRSNKGAVGLWQFMPRTAAGFKIRMNRWYDGRRDVVASTDAALRYLTYLYYFFDKDWLIAIASYDCGEGNMQSAILRNKRRGYSTDLWSLYLPKETRDYLPQLLALSAIIRNPGKYGISLVPINNGPYFDRINVGESISLEKAARMSGTNLWTMRMLNAGLLRGVTEPDGPYVIAMPHNRIRVFKDSLSGKTSVAPPPAVAFTPNPAEQNIGPESAQMPTIFNNTAEDTARMSALASEAANENESMVSRTKNEENLANSVDNEGNEVSMPQHSKVINKKIARKQGPGQTRAKTSTKQYIVGHDETLFSIARQYDTSVTTLRRVNKLKNNNIKPGQMLSIPVKGTVSDFSDNISQVNGNTDNADSSGTVHRAQKVRRTPTTQHHATASSHVGMHRNSSTIHHVSISGTAKKSNKRIVHRSSKKAVKHT